MSTHVLRRTGVLVCLLVGLVQFSGAARAKDPVAWSYEGETGPEHWGELSPDYALCATGKNQTPIDIPASAPFDSDNVTYRYTSSAINIANNGHTVQVNYDPGSTLELEGTTYELVQFHFHAHSEHTKAGKATPIEMHLVHKNAEGKLAVVGVWLTSGSENPAFAPVFTHLPATESVATLVPGETVDANALLPVERVYYRYDGSLTTPPCTENVKWVMMGSPVELSDAQINAYTSVFADDFRPVQPFGARTFLTSAPRADGAVAGLPTTGQSTAQPIMLLITGGLLVLVVGVFMRRRAT